MCFGNKLKGEDFSVRPNASPVDFNQRPSSSKMPQYDNYAPPPGPPPSHRQAQNEYTSPPGPPPSHQVQDEYTPPFGPPPHLQAQDDYAPPPGPPPSHSRPWDAAPDPQAPSHDWESAVPDNSLLPPPPSFFSGNDRSATNNATEDQAEAGEDFVKRHGLSQPGYLPQAAWDAVKRGEVGVRKPPDYLGSLEQKWPGVWEGETKRNSPDSCISSSIPLYSAINHSPLRTQNGHTIYYEVKILRSNRKEVSLAIGYAAPPYPEFRLPGWHRGSLAVHGDDGSKFINDRWGGKNFTDPFKPGETIGLGMAFTPRGSNPGPVPTASAPINVEIFFTRNGRHAGGWNLHEEIDSKVDLPVVGLEGMCDIYATIGTFDNVKFEIVFSPDRWMYKST